MGSGRCQGYTGSHTEWAIFTFCLNLVFSEACHFTDSPSYGKIISYKGMYGKFY